MNINKVRRNQSETVKITNTAPKSETCCKILYKSNHRNQNVFHRLLLLLFTFDTYLPIGLKVNAKHL